MNIKRKNQKGCERISYFLINTMIILKIIIFLFLSTEALSTQNHFGWETSILHFIYLYIFIPILTLFTFYELIYLSIIQDSRILICLSISVMLFSLISFLFVNSTSSMLWLFTFTILALITCLIELYIHIDTRKMNNS